MWRLLGRQSAALSGDVPGPVAVPLPDPRTSPDPEPPQAARQPADLSQDEPSPSGEPVRLSGSGAFDPGRRGVKALAALAVVVVLVAAGWAWQSRPRSVPVADAPVSAVAPGREGADPASGPGEGGPVPAAPGASPGGAEVVVAVAGKVRRPGLVRLSAGARVADALQAAGGPLNGVDVALLNLARKVTDGELILVGVTAPPGAGQGGPAGNPAPGMAGVGAPGAGGKVSLNAATLAELDALPGVGPVLAQRIIDHRDQHGGFRAVSDLRQVTGIGDARYEDLKNLVTL